MSDVIYEYTVKVRMPFSLREDDKTDIENSIKYMFEAGEACVMPDPVELDADLYELRHLLPAKE